MVSVDPISLLALFSLTIAIGYIGSFIFKKTGISDVIWLLIAGILIGPVFGFVERSLFMSVLPLFSALALIFILFDAGLNLDFYQMVKGLSRSMLLTVMGISLSMVLVAGLSIFLLKFDLVNGLLLGAIVGGTSSAIVISISEKLKLRGEARTVLELESIFSDPFVVVIPIALIGIILATGQGQILVANPVGSILSAFSIGGVFGIVFGLAWHFILTKLKESHLEYIITLAALFLVYIFVETFNGSGAIAALLFGLVLGNRKTFTSILKVSGRFREGENIIQLHSELSFFIRSFFFVFLGLIATMTFEYVLYGLAIIGVIIVARLISVQISTFRMAISKTERNIFRIMIPRGLAAAVMAQIVITQGIPNSAAFSSIAFVVILGTTIITTGAAKFFFRAPRTLDVSGKKDKKVDKKAQLKK